MQETTEAFLFIDDPKEGASLPAVGVRLKGWAVGKPGYFLTDLRVSCAGRVFPAFYGIPRPDLAQFFKAREPWLPAGFEVDVSLVEGSNHFEFEGCEVSGRWVKLGAVTLQGTPAPAAAPLAAARLDAAVFARGLRLVLQRTVNADPSAAAAAVAALLPQPHVTRFPSLPFHGHLHHPPMLQRTEFGRVIVEGWLFHETEKIRRIAATVDLQAWQLLEQEGDFPYVAGLYPQFPQARGSRFHGAIDVPSQLPRPLSVRLYAELADGSWHLCHVERSHLYGDEQAKAPFAPFGLGTFVQSVRALRSACQARGLAVPVDRWFIRALREVWGEYRARAPRGASTLPAPAALPALAQAAPLPGEVLLVTHNLNQEGAPLFLLEYAAHLASHGVKLTVVSAADGGLRSRFEALGAGVRIVDPTPLTKAKSAAALRSTLRALGAQLDLTQAGLVVANTLSGYWAVHLARQAGRPSLFYIHESTTPDCFYFGYMHPATLPVVKETFRVATHVSFLTDATRRYYLPLLAPANHSLNPGWIDLARLDRYQSEHPKSELRRRLGLGAGQRLVVNVGAVCNRKGQHIFARAVDLLWRRQPALAAECEFLMVGGRDTAFDRAIASLVADLGRANLRVVAETTEPGRYYGAADLFVCSSYEESFPRVVLEAMAFSVPIVSTDVHGIPEMARADQEALLVPAGDPSALADAMARVLADTNLSTRLATAARARVVANYDAAQLLPHHAGLAAAVGSLPA